MTSPTSTTGAPLDQFTYVNNSLGHQGGDDLLKSMSNLLAHVIADRGVLARLGGDEFAILLPDIGPCEAELFAGQLVDAIVQNMVDTKVPPGV